MALIHEYALLDGVNRSNIGRYIAVVSAILSGLMVSGLIFIINWWERLGLIQHPQVVAVPVTTGIVYLVLYYFFRHWAWKWPWVAKFLKVPDLSGDWLCEGQTMNPKEGVQAAWKGTLSITQDWDMIRVSISTEQSRSESIAAALQFDPHHGYHLLYTYKNEPGAGSPVDMQHHRGAAHLTFSKDLLAAEGDYFNGRGRYTFGVMKLSRSMPAA
jgi:hypothetical protein